VPRLIVLDAMNLTYRAYHALLMRDKVDPSKWVPLRNSRGEATNAILGFANTVLKIRREEQPDYWVLAWDGPGPTFRHERYAEYKATRKPMPDDLLPQIEPVERMAQALGLPVIEIPGMEADDVMATLARRGERDGFDVVLVSGDKDLMQLVSDKIQVLAPLRRGDDYAWIDRAAVVQKWGVPPERVVDVLALLGDTIDNVPGVPGIGEKTADELMRAYGSLEGIYENLAAISKKAVKSRLEAGRESAFLSRELIALKTDLELPFGWEDLRVRPIRRSALTALTRRYEMTAFEKRALELAVGDEEAGAVAPGRDPGRRGRVDSQTVAPELAPAEPEFAESDPAFAPAPAPVDPADLRPFVSGPVAAGAIQGALDLFAPVATAEPGLDPAALLAAAADVVARAAHGLAVVPLADRGGRLVGLALAAADTAAVYLPIAHEHGGNLDLDAVRARIGAALADPSVPKLGGDLKRAAHRLERAGIPLGGLEFDAHVASFLLDPERAHDLASLARDAIGVALPPLAAPAAPRGKPAPDVSSVPADVMGPAVAAHAAALIPLAEALRAQLEARDQWRLYQDLERPLIRVLLDMERAGIAVDRALLEDMGARAAADLARLEQELFAIAGGPLNLQSGPQLAQVLFEKLQLKAGRRTKTGFSTDQAVLEELARAHPFPARLLEYRALAKLKSTYLDALPLAIDPRDRRVHTSYDQAGAATGRLSSHDPNLQNIPMRTEQGRAIRRAFIALPGAVLVSADYSQIELRVMAHLSGDPQLREAFTSGEDVHASTARRVFKVTGDLDPGLRARAKIVNFGVMYGMGPRSLSQQMDIPLTEAQDFIRRYFETFSGVRTFLDHTLEEGRRRGFVATVLGRRRYLAELTSPHGGERSNAERAAINAPIQGSAADIVKLAMVKVHHALMGSYPSARLLLQVHDELLFECPEQEAEAVSEVVRVTMETCFPLRVPLQVSVGCGRTWFDAH
jgi:DNA polymerase-1